MHPLSRRLMLGLAGAYLAGPAEAAKAKPPPPQRIIGAALPRSGDLALIGDECLRGIELAAGAVNASGGIAGQPVQLVTADAVDQADAGAAVNRLLKDRHAGLILSAGASELSYPASAAAELAQIPCIELNAIADGITARGFKYLLRTGPTSTMIAAVARATVQQRFVHAKIGLLFNTGAAGGAIAAAVLSAFKQAQIQPLLAVGYPEDVTDLAGPAMRLQRAGAELVVHAAGADDALAFFLALQEQGWQPKAVLGCGKGYSLRETAAALGARFDGTFAIASPFYPASAQPIAEAYLARFGMPPRAPDSLTAYVGARLVFDTLAAAGGDPAKLLGALRQANIPAGGLINGWGAAFDQNGQNTRAFATLQRWRNQTLQPA
ncbi:MAG: hypothetical protein B7Z81_00140 [Acidocella sp. 20-61-6]|nr:MAG: hypothetical protein B7Z81_00140 [Acidocella sp. 20-61-6]